MSQWGDFVVSGCNLVNCPLNRSLSGSCFGAGFLSRNVGTRCVGFRVPGVSRLGTVLLAAPSLEKLGIAVPCGRRIVPFYRRLSRRTGTVNTIGIVHVARQKGGALLGNFGSSLMNFARDLHPLLRHCRRQTLVLNANNTTGTVSCNLEDLKLSAVFISHADEGNILACSSLAPRVVGSCGIIIGYAPINVRPHVASYPTVPCSTLSGRSLLCSLVCGPRRAAFLTGNHHHKTIAGGNLRVLLLRTFTS